MFKRVLLALSMVLTTGFASLAASETTILAGGCFWCIQKDFDHVKGVIKTVPGYAGGQTDSPTYKTYAAGGHREVLQVTYDPEQISYEALLHIFWRTVDPTDGGGQFCDRGVSYSTAIYAANDAERKVAEQSKAQAQAALGKTIVTPVVGAAKFWPAEDFHQDYYKKNPWKYKFYRSRCGRDQTVKRLWGNAAYSGVAH